MVLGLNAQVLEHRVRPEPFHRIPILNLTVSDGIVDTIPGPIGGRQSFVANEEIQVFRATL